MRGIIQADALEEGGGEGRARTGGGVHVGGGSGCVGGGVDPRLICRIGSGAAEACRRDNGRGRTSERGFGGRAASVGRVLEPAAVTELALPAEEVRAHGLSDVLSRPSL